MIRVVTITFSKAGNHKAASYSWCALFICVCVACVHFIFVIIFICVRGRVCTVPDLCVVMIEFSPSECGYCVC